MSAAPIGSEVWILDFSTEGPEPGDYDGWQSVHASHDGAIERLGARLAEHGLRLPKTEDHTSAATAEDGSFAGEFELAGVSVSYGVHRMPVEP